MEAALNAGESKLSSQFRHSMPPMADYVTDRKMVRFYPQGSNHYSPNGVKMCRFSITGDSWLDPYTCNLNFTVVNSSYDAANADTPRQRDVGRVDGDDALEGALHLGRRGIVVDAL